MTSEKALSTYDNPDATQETQENQKAIMQRIKNPRIPTEIFLLKAKLRSLCIEKSETKMEKCGMTCRANETVKMNGKPSLTVSFVVDRIVDTEE